MKENKIYSLSELVDFYGVILPDTSVLSNCLNFCNIKNMSAIRNKTIKSEEQYLSYSFWKKFILENSKNNILFSEGVIEELENMRKIKFTRKFKGHKIDPNFKELSRNLNYAVNRKNNLVKVLVGKDLILKLSKEEQITYEENTGNFKYLVKKRDYGLSSVDFSLIVTGATLSENRGRIVLISNDFQILHACNSILSKQKNLRGKLDFYTRDNFDGFKKRSNSF